MAVLGLEYCFFVAKKMTANLVFMKKRQLFSRKWVKIAKNVIIHSIDLKKLLTKYLHYTKFFSLQLKTRRKQNMYVFTLQNDLA
jgi:hypothetical protein